ncbi:sensor histidine kinase [Halobacteriaceae archaeon SHR40]|uniref:sensor histidine kinase n=1 Tax=Halovenus amylolytica TaxID=2500550 RepID=UPI000FE3F9C7
MSRSEGAGDYDEKGWLLETIRATQQLIAVAKAPAEIGTKLPERLVQPEATQVAWIGQPTPQGGIRIRASSQPLPDRIEGFGDDSRTSRALDTEAVQTDSADPEYEQLRDERGLPAVENTVALPLTESVLHLYTDGVLTDGSAELLETLNDVLATGLHRARLSEELDRERRRLEELRELVSHDLGNPLNLAAGRLDLVKMECDSEHIEHVENGLQQIDELADEGTTFVTVGRGVSERDTLSLEEIGRDCWRYASTQRGTLDIEAATIEADPERLRRILNELIGNTFAHTEGPVTVEIGHLENAAGFYVADDGAGIPEEDREYVFDRGYTTVSDRDGNGLAIVEEIVKAHGWAIHLADGPGTRIEIRTERW